MDKVPDAQLAGLTDGQRNATRMILESPDRFTLVQGYAGLEDSPVYYPKRIESIRRMHEYGFRSEDEATVESEAK